MTNITNDEARCTGDRCPSALNCRRFTERGTTDYAWFAAFWARREAGASACESFRPVVIVSTFSYSGRNPAGNSDGAGDRMMEAA